MGFCGDGKIQKEEIITNLSTEAIFSAGRLPITNWTWIKHERADQMISLLFEIKLIWEVNAMELSQELVRTEIRNSLMRLAGLEDFVHASSETRKIKRSRPILNSKKNIHPPAANDRWSFLL